MNTNILIESTKSFEDDIAGLSMETKAMVIREINDCASIFLTHKTEVYGELRQIHLNSNLNGYESSLYILNVSGNIGLILSIDEDPIFGQVILTLFRAVQYNDAERVYRLVAESLYQGMIPHSTKSANGAIISGDRETVLNS